MSSQPTFSFVYDRADAARVFPEVGTHDLVLAVLARVPADAGWEGCTVYKGEAPERSARMVCIAMRGRAAIEVQEHVVEAFEATGIPIPTIYEGGPEPELEIATVVNGTWVAP